MIYTPQRNPYKTKNNKKFQEIEVSPFFAYVNSENINFTMEFRKNTEFQPR